MYALVDWAALRIFVNQTNEVICGQVFISQDYFIGRFLSVSVLALIAPTLDVCSVPRIVVVTFIGCDALGSI